MIQHNVSGIFWSRLTKQCCKLYLEIKVLLEKGYKHSSEMGGRGMHTAVRQGLWVARVRDGASRKESTVEW